ncbi:ABC-type polysaccharide/polyol phosphate transport system ATPase subunit [Paenibacillus sp. JGP012]|uniref:ABC transporter ATP-binding protein n=1 Tax=Paenibacillus sp. JGP012 TaxID=2735914 RepID=UPI00160EDFC4|nr:ABC transporter ATP-binding protein [Paenibacillus sp. JGP012]MBB6024666.1 ABC-type polysaccharide/polyol phosphate transport system ATPase subunit [Paenibacillus sp. JGP012]
MSQDEVVIKIDSISKLYKMYKDPKDRLKEALNPFSKSYHKDFFALRDVSFEVHRGETVGIIGRNGAGKSTLLKIITGVLNPTDGSITANGRISALLELGAGFNPELSGIENVYFNGMLLGMTKQQMDERIEEILTFADIGDHVYQPVKTYSSGMFVRLAFSVAVSVDPEILIVDEALAVGDVRFRQKALRKMKEQMQKAKAILFVTHDMESIKNFCTKVVWIKDGTVHEIGEPKDVIQRYYNYMTHDIETQAPNVSTEKSLIADIQYNDGELYWSPVKKSEIVGGKGVEVNKVAVKVNGRPYIEGQAIEGNEEMEFFFDVNIFESIYEPLAGFGIFNQYGVPIIHFNSSNIENSSLKPLHTGNRTIISFKFKLPKLQLGNYTVSFGLNDGTLDDNRIVQHVRECSVIKVVPSSLETRQHGIIIADKPEINIDLVEE